jgi:Phosphotransferase enzyme family
VVSAALGRPLGRPGPWVAASIFDPVTSGTGGIWRLRGSGWSVVLKVVHHSDRGHEHWLSGRDPSHWYYWRREVFAYTSGLLASLSGGLRAPRCHLATEGPGESVRLWLEDVADRPATAWPLERYRMACRHLGQAQGAFLVDRPLPDERWLSRQWLRAYLRQRAGNIALLDDPQAWANPVVAEAFPNPPVEDLRRMWKDQERFLASLDRMPRTLCHLDLHPKNLFDVGGKTVLIDWSFVGIGAVGEDAGNLVADTVLDFHVFPEQIGRLWDSVIEGYLTGLAEAGWDGDPQTVSRAMSATIASGYAWIAPAILRVANDGRSTHNGKPLVEGVQWWAMVTPFLLRMADEARGHD